MTTQHLERPDGTIAYDDTGGAGRLIVMLPGAGNTRSEYRFLAPLLAETGARIVTADLRGHGESSAEWPSYGMDETAGDLEALLRHLDAGPATVVATSFSPTAAICTAADHPELVDQLVIISAHLDAAPGWQGALLRGALRGPLAAPIWASQFRKWHPGAPPADLDDHIGQLKRMLSTSERREAMRVTLTAHRNGLDSHLSRLAAPTLVVMGAADDHFPDATAEGTTIAGRTNGTLSVIPDAGHYPHVEYPEVVADAVIPFLEGHA